MQRRKYLAAIGSLAAGGAAMTSTGAFTSVEADRGLTVNTRFNGDALLGIQRARENGDVTSNADTYVEGRDTPDGFENELKIVLGGGKFTDAGAYGVNGSAVTIIRDLLDFTNQGSQKVYVYIDGAPDKVRFFHDDPDFPKAEDDGEYTGNLSNPGNGRFQPDDPDASESSNYYKLPDLDPGDSLENVGLRVDTTEGNVQTDGEITIVAGTLDELEG
jgi:hypothetical protein